MTGRLSTAATSRASVVPSAAVSGSQSPCDHCAAPCCRRYSVVLLGREAFHLAAHLKVPLDEFCELRWTERRDGHYRIVLDGTPGAAPRFHRLVLRKAPDPEPRYESRCVFLLSIGERGRCGVYDLRPSACALYPTSLRDGLLGLEGGGRYCPEGAWQLPILDAPRLRAAHLQREAERRLWDGVVDGWNERVVAERLVADAPRFHAFVWNVYQELAQLEGRGEGSGAALLDGVLRRLGWRTDATVAAAATGGG